jgi:hypothetical protein
MNIQRIILNAQVKYNCTVPLWKRPPSEMMAPDYIVRRVAELFDRLIVVVNLDGDPLVKEAQNNATSLFFSVVSRVS